ncbi:MAG TPA: DNA ligase D [Terriglobia bacterium]|nr:DNA ligase D [Terriglobia bacterium]
MMAKLDTYKKKRNFQKTSEPSGTRRVRSGGNRFVVQKHDATRLHYDFRLEVRGVLVSWAVPKGPSMNPADKRLAIQTEDHPLDYIDFEGVIPENNYGAGPVEVWDNGTYEVEDGLNAERQINKGEIKFVLHGRKLHGGFVLVRTSRQSKDGKSWLIIKHRDASADPRWNIDDRGESVISGRSIREIEEGVQPFDRVSPESVEGARKAPMPSHVSPTLAVLAEHPFSDPEWVFEIKWDGVRALARVDRTHLQFRSRRDQNITANYPEFSGLPRQLRVNEAILDGEIVALDESGHSDFERLQSRMNVSNPSPSLVKQTPVTYCVFDLLYCDGYDLRRAALGDRKRLLRDALEFTPPIIYSDHQIEKGKELFDLAKKNGLEGVIAKQIRSPYPGERTNQWQKFKTVEELDVVVGGYTAPRGGRTHFGALLLGLYSDGKLLSVGGVGTGFDQKYRKKIFDMMEPLRAQHCSFHERPDTREKAFWIKPELVARIRCANWTREKRLRAPVFLGLLPDHNPRECRFETEASPKAQPGHSAQPAHPKGSRSPRARASDTLTRESDIERELFHGHRDDINIELDGKPLRLTHLNKIYYPKTGHAKRDLIAYYYRVAPLILPFLRDRPMVLRRYPDGVGGKAFFQKEAGESYPSWMETVAVESEENAEVTHYFLAQNRASLLFLTNLGCIDHNPWFSRRDDLKHPDYFFFDLDPSERTSFKTVITVAREIYRELTELGVRAFLKTSGATGFHIYVPIKREYDYEQLRNFAEIVGQVASGKRAALVTSNRRVSERKAGTVLIDAAQNSYGRSLAAPYSLRAVPGAAISCPVSSDELSSSVKPERFNLNSIFKRLETKGDLWQDFWKARQPLTKAIDTLDRQLKQSSR